jgi:hypothetical protein
MLCNVTFSLLDYLDNMQLGDLLVVTSCVSIRLDIELHIVQVSVLL